MLICSFIFCFETNKTRIVETFQNYSRIKRKLLKNIKMNFESFNICQICDGAHDETDCEFYLSFTLPEHGSSVDPATITRTVYQDDILSDAASLSSSASSEAEALWDMEVRLGGPVTTYSLGDPVNRRGHAPAVTTSSRQSTDRTRPSIDVEPTTAPQHELSGDFPPPPSYQELYPHGPPLQEVILSAVMQILRREGLCRSLPDCIHCNRC